MAYQGPERRIHKVYATRNTHYHIRKDRCVGVQAAESGTWLHTHAALNRRLVCALRDDGALMEIAGGDPAVGDVLCFEGAVITTAIRNIDRPERDVVEQYQF